MSQDTAPRTRRLPRPGAATPIALLALVMAMGGTSLAGSAISGSALANGSVSRSKIAAKAIPAGFPPPLAPPRPSTRPGWRGTR